MGLPGNIPSEWTVLGALACTKTEALLGEKCSCTLMPTLTVDKKLTV